MFFTIRLWISSAILWFGLKNYTKKINIGLLLCRYQELVHSCQYKLNLVNCMVHFSQLNGVMGDLIEVLIRIPLTLMIWARIHKFIGLVCFLFWAISVCVFCPFFYFIFLLICRCSFYILDTTPLVCVLQISSFCKLSFQFDSIF